MNFKKLNKPFIIADMCSNHNHNLETALAIVDAAAKARADALRLQTSTADMLTIKSDRKEFIVKEKNSLWHGQSLYDIYKTAHIPLEWHKEIFNRCREHGLLCYSSPGSAEAVDFLEEFNPPFYEISSYDNADHRLIKRVAQTKKPVILPICMLSVEELNESIDVLKNNGCKDIVLLKCAIAYPSRPADANLATLSDMKERFPDCTTGLMDFSLGKAVSLAAVALGAKVLQRRITLLSADGCIDSAYSLEPSEFETFVESVNTVYQAIGKVSYGKSTYKYVKQFRRSLYVVKPLAKGEKFTPEHVKSIRVANGLPAKRFEEVMTKTASRNIVEGVPLAEDMLS